jgi:hypothetical protein
MMPIQVYPNGEPVCVGDVVDHAGVRGLVVAASNGESLQECTASFEWTQGLGDGVWIQFDNDAVVRIGESDEDIVLVARGD